MSHTPPTPLTTLISSRSPVLDKTPEPRVPLIHVLTATKPPPAPHEHCRHPRILTLSQHTPMQHKQQYMHHSRHNNRTHTIGYYDDLTNRPRTTTGLLTPHRPSSKSEINLITLRVNINGLRNKLQELRSGHCMLLNSYKKRLQQIHSSSCLDGGMDPHEVLHLFNCTVHSTDLTPVSLW